MAHWYIPSHSEADWGLFVPVFRDEELIKGERKRLIRGIAATESKDKHGEELILAGMDFAPYLKKGRLNYDHLKGPQHVLGKPLEAKIIPNAGAIRKGMSGEAFYHLCELYDTEPGRAAWDLLKSEEGDDDRQHGFSVEGAITETERNKLTKTRVDDVALTPQPANVETYAEFAKSLSAGAAQALELQNLDTGLATERMNQAVNGFDSLSDIIWGECNHNCYDEHGRFRKGAKSAYFHLVKCRGTPEDEALLFVKNLAKSGIF